MASDSVMGKIQEAEKNARKVVADAMQKSSSIIADAKVKARKAYEDFKAEVVKKNELLLESLLDDLNRKELLLDKDIKAKIVDMKKEAKTKVSRLEEKLFSVIVE